MTSYCLYRAFRLLCPPGAIFRCGPTAAHPAGALIRALSAPRVRRRCSCLVRWWTQLGKLARMHRAFLAWVQGRAGSTAKSSAFARASAEEREARRCGGAQGRNTLLLLQVCYSWWCLSALAILGRLHWIDQPALTAFILDCQARGLHAARAAHALATVHAVHS